jgi:hypothetical protein
MERVLRIFSFRLRSITSLLRKSNAKALALQIHVTHCRVEKLV